MAVSTCYERNMNLIHTMSAHQPQNRGNPWNEGHIDMVCMVREGKGREGIYIYIMDADIRMKEGTKLCTHTSLLTSMYIHAFIIDSSLIHCH